jgi:hypothetical protein
MRIIRRTAVAVIGAVALAGALALPTTASAAATSRAGGASPQLYRDFFILNHNGEGLYAVDGDVYLGVADRMENIDEDTVDGHVYYEYEDVSSTGFCLQANVGDAFMTDGRCVGASRQFWWWNGTVLTNLAFGSKAYASGDQADLGFESGDAYDWTIART